METLDVCALFTFSLVSLNDKSYRTSLASHEHNLGRISFQFSACTRKKFYTYIYLYSAFFYLFFPSAVDRKFRTDVR